MNANRLRFRSVTLALVLVVAGALAASCGSDEPSSSSTTAAGDPRTYIGAAVGTAAFVAVVVDGSRVLAYACDGTPAEPTGTVPTIQAWWNGASDGRSVDVQQPAGRLRVQLTDNAMTGTLTLADGRVLQVAGQPAAAEAGLYRAEASGTDAKAVAGWILAANGEQRGGLGTESGGTIKLSGTRVLNLSQPTLNVQGLATARISKVGITPIPIP
jgi:hypothetical protein